MSEFRYLYGQGKENLHALDTEIEHIEWTGRLRDEIMLKVRGPAYTDFQNDLVLNATDSLKFISHYGPAVEIVSLRKDISSLEGQRVAAYYKEDTLTLVEPPQ